MNAISVTMAKGIESRRQHNLAIQLMSLIVISSWLGCQLLVVSGCFFREDLPESVSAFIEAGVLLLFCSLYLLLCFKRLNESPNRESAQLFFGLFLLILPVLSWLVLMYIGSTLDFLASMKKTTGVGQAIKWASVFVSLIYFIVTTMWMRTVAPYYDQAKLGSFPYMVMRRLEALIVEPYMKR